MPYWKRDNLRNSLKALKKTLDNLDKNRKAAILNEVSLKCGRGFWMLVGLSLEVGQMLVGLLIFSTNVAPALTYTLLRRARKS